MAGVASVFVGVGSVAGAGAAGAVSEGFALEDEAAVGVASSFFALSFFLKALLKIFFILSNASGAGIGPVRQINLWIKNRVVWLMLVG